MFCGSALHEFKRLPKDQAERIYAALNILKENPFPSGSEKLKGIPLYRLRIGKYRAVYAIHPDSKEIEVVQVGHRKDIYKKLRSLLF